MATLHLPNNRIYKYYDSHIIKLLENANKDIYDLEELVYINEKNRLNQIEEGFSNIKKYLSNTNKSSTFLGSIGEQYIQDELTSINIPWKDTSQIPNNGDIEIDLQNQKVLLDVKNYTNNVPSHEVDKLFYDCDKNNIKYSILISLKSNIAKKKCFEIEQRDNVSMIFVKIQNSNDMKNVINVMNALILKDDCDDRQYINKDKLTNCFEKLNEKVKSITTLKQKCNDFHEIVEKHNKDILKSINNFQNEIHEILYVMEDECKNPSNILMLKHSVNIQTFKYDNWKFVLNDLKNYNLIYIKQSPNSIEIQVMKNDIIVATLVFNKTKLVVTKEDEMNTSYRIESVEKWIKLFNIVFN